MKSILHSLQNRVVLTTSIAALFVLSLTADRVQAATTKTWNGGAGTSKWSENNNWVGGLAPAGGDSLIFAGNTRTTTTNNITSGTSFGSITFNGPGAFILRQNSIVLSGNITNNQVVTLQTISLPITLGGSPTVNVTGTGFLTMGGQLSGAGGVTKVGGGTLTLSANNNPTWTGPLTINGGTVVISADNRLGAVPAVVTPGMIVMNGGTLSARATFTMNARRGMSLGNNGGGFDVPDGLVLTYNGTISNAVASVGGLSKHSYGQVTIGSSNAYTGPTAVKVGFLRLDFAQVGAVTNNIINTNSALSLGGELSDNGTADNATLTINPKGGALVTNNQTFSSTFIDQGPTVIQVFSNNSGGVNLNLGQITHKTGGYVVIEPPTFRGGKGNITTTSTNINGILGGWAFVGNGTFSQNLNRATNYASVDPNGNIVAYNNFTVWSSGYVRDIVSGGTNNVMIDASSSGDAKVDVDHGVGLGTTTDVNTVSFYRPVAWSFQVGSNNVLRLGRFGGMFSMLSASSPTWEIGNSAGGANSVLVQNVGTLTAGGPNDNTPGEIVLMENQTGSGSANNLDMDLRITDNGTGKVTLVKAGSGYMKLRGNNTYSGGTFLLGGRLQLSGTDAGGAPNDYSTGPVVCFPGAYIFLGNASAPDITNDVSIAGGGTVQEPLGSIRQGGQRITGNITLIGDAQIGGNGGSIPGKISGPFNLTIGSYRTVNGTVTLSSQLNDWSGDTILQARLANSGTGHNGLNNGTNDVIPNGVFKGNVIMISTNRPGGTSQSIAWNLNGFNETINGLGSISLESQTNAFIQNNNAGQSTLTLGDNNQSGTFYGSIQDNAGTGGSVALTKIGAGTETLSGPNSYSGNTIVSNGVLAVGAGGSIGASLNIQVYTNAALDVSGASAPGFSTTHVVSMTNATLIGNTAPAPGGITTLNMKDSALTVGLNQTTTNVFATTLNTDGTNRINIAQVIGVTGYPAAFTVAKYTSTTQPDGTNATLVIGSVPSSSTAGYISNKVSESRVVLLLTDGPKTLTWVGTNAANVNATLWDVNTTANWLAFGTTPAVFNKADSVLVNDTAATNVLNLVDPTGTNFLEPADIVVSNVTKDFTFTGTNYIAGSTRLTKYGASTLTIGNTGNGGSGNEFKGGVLIAGGGGKVIFASDNTISGGITIPANTTVQVGTNTGTGTLPSGPVTMDGSLIINRGTNMEISGAISGADTGTLTNDTHGELTLSGGNSFTGMVDVVSGSTVVLGASQNGGNTAVGRTNGGPLIIENGATLDFNVLNVGQKYVVVSGAGAPGQGGALVNNGNAGVSGNVAIQRMVMVGDTTVGGLNRWDLRSSTTSDLNGSSLVCSNGAHNLIKIGTNQVTICGSTVDPTLGDIDIQEGVFSFEVAASSMGDPGSNLYVRAHACLQLFNIANTLDKKIQLFGDGVSNVVRVTSGSANNLQGPVTLNGSCLFFIDGNNVALRLLGPVTGSGSIQKFGSGILSLNNGSDDYTGPTIVSNGVLFVVGNKTGDGIVRLEDCILGGTGNIQGNTTINRGGIQPGSTLSQEIAPLGFPGVTNTLTLNNTITNVFQLSSTIAFGDSDGVDVSGNLTLNGTNVFYPIVDRFTDAGKIYTLFRYDGALSGDGLDTNTHMVIVNPVGYVFNWLDPLAPGNSNKIQIRVDKAIGNLTWTGSANNQWNTIGTLNWLKNGVSAYFTNTDIVNFDNGAAPNTNIVIVGEVTPSAIRFANSSSYEYGLQGTGYILGTNGFERYNTTTPGDGGLVTIYNSGSNQFSGPILIGDGTLQVGNGGTAGNLGWGGTITMYASNNPALIYNRSDNLVQSNTYVGGGTITKKGAGILSVIGDGSGLTGTVVVAEGTLQLDNDNPLGDNTNCTIIVSNGASLDVAGPTVGTSASTAGRINVSGAGVGGQGAIVNNGTNSNTSALQGKVTLTGDVTLGGTARWDLRNGSGAWLMTDPPLSPYNITKIGTNQIALVAVTNIDAGIYNVDVKEGIFALQTSSVQLGDPNGTITVYSNAQFDEYNLTAAAVNKKILLLDGATLTNENSTCTNIGTITLGTNVGANCVLGVAGTALELIGNTLNGPGNLIKDGGSALILSNANTYTGSTIIKNGRVALIADTDLTNTTSIEMSLTSSIIDVATKSDGTLTVKSLQPLQLLKGHGEIRGNLTVGGGGEVQPGVFTDTSTNNLGVQYTGTLTVTNVVTLGGTTTIYINKSAGPTSGRIVGAQAINYGGTLTVVTNIAETTNWLANGDSFLLFGPTNIAGSFFAATNLPGFSKPGFQWDTSTLNVDGTIRVVSTVTNQPTVTSDTVEGSTNLILTGTGGVAFGQFYVLTSTNVTTPLTNWSKLATNFFDASGNFSVTNLLGTNATQALPRRFIAIQVP